MLRARHPRSSRKGSLKKEGIVRIIIQRTSRLEVSSSFFQAISISRSLKNNGNQREKQKKNVGWKFPVLLELWGSERPATNQTDEDATNESADSIQPIDGDRRRKNRRAKSDRSKEMSGIIEDSWEEKRRAGRSAMRVTMAGVESVDSSKAEEIGSQGPEDSPPSAAACLGPLPIPEKLSHRKRLMRMMADAQTESWKSDAMKSAMGLKGIIPPVPRRCTVLKKVFFPPIRFLTYSKSKGRPEPNSSVYISCKSTSKSGKE